MKKIVFIALLNMLGSLLAAQNISFNKTYSIIPGYGSGSAGVSVVSNGYIIYGVTVYAPGQQAIGTLKIDNSGNSIWAKYLPNKYYNFNYTAYANESGIDVPWGGEIVTGVLQNDSTGFYNWALYRFDSEGDTIWTKNYKDSANFWTDQIKVTKNYKYLIYGQWENLKSLRNAFSTLVLVKTDSLGNKIWERTYSGLRESRTATGMDTCSDGGFILCAYSYDTTSYCGGQILVMKTDSAGKAQWSKYISGSPCDIRSGGITSLKDGGYAVCGFYDDTNNSLHNQYNPVLYVAKLSGSGSVIWSKKYGQELAAIQAENYLIKPIELANGDIVICGSALDIVDSVLSAGCILKIDSNGNEKWLKFYVKYPSAFYQHYFNDIEPANDGGFIVTGYINNADSTVMWAVKTDSSGIVTGLPSLYRTANNGIIVYPNPSKGLFTFYVTSPVAGTIEVYNITGQEIYRQAIHSDEAEINIGNQPNGMYFYRATTNTGSLIGEGKVVIEK